MAYLGHLRLRQFFLFLKNRDHFSCFHTSRPAKDSIARIILPVNTFWRAFCII